MLTAKSWGKNQDYQNKTDDKQKRRAGQPTGDGC
jgi:hypothetical protein